MKKSIISLLGMMLIFYMLVPLVFSQENDEVLVIVKSPKSKLLPYQDDLKIFYHDDDVLLIEIARSDLALFRNKNINYQIIDEKGWTGSYYIVSKRKNSPTLSKLDIGETIYSHKNFIIQKVEQQHEEALFRSGYHLIKITPIAKPLAKGSVSHFIMTGAGPDPLIVDIIENVSRDSLYRFVQRLQDFRSRYTYSDSIVPAGQWIYNKYRSFGYSDVQFDTFYVNGFLHRNVIATKPGLVYSDSVIMIGGHYDSIVLGSGVNPYVWAPGADDNASGTVSALEAARVLANHNFEATIKFVAWDAEEIGLRGSDAYAQQAYNDEEPIGLYLNFDMIGNYDPDDPIRDFSIFTDEPSTPFAQLLAKMMSTYTPIVPIIYGNSNGSDHRSFQLWGYRAIFGIEGDFSPNWHTNTDITDNMDFSYMKDVVQGGLATLIYLSGPADNFGGNPYVKYKNSIIDDDTQGSSLGNGNGYIDAGEIIELAITVKNYGEREADQVNGVLRCSDPLVNLIDSTQSFGSIAPSDEASSSDKFVFQVSSEAPSGHIIKFELILNDNSDRSWASNFNLKVKMPEIVFLKQHVTEVSGNGDDKIDPGERFDIIVELENIGQRDAARITVVLGCDHESISIIDSIAQFDNIPKSATGTNSQDRLTIEIKPDATTEIIPFYLNVYEGSGFYSTTITFNIAVGQGKILLVEDDGFRDLYHYYREALNFLGINYDYWNTNVEGAVPTDTLLNYEVVLWYTATEFRNSLYNSGSTNLENYLAHGGRLFINGSVWPLSVKNTTLMSHYLFAEYVSFQTNLHHLKSVPANPVLGDRQFWLAREGENSQHLSGEIDPIAPAKTLLIYDQRTSEGAGDLKSSGSAALYVSNQNYRVVMFAFGWEGIEEQETRLEVLVDILNYLQDVQTQVADQLTEADIPQSYQLQQNFPNPFNPTTRINFQLPKTDLVTLSILNIKGQIIKTLIDNNLPAGLHSIIWDGRDNQSQKVASGVYFCQMQTGDFIGTIKMLLLY